MTPKMIKETALGLTEDDSIRRGRYGAQVVSFFNRQHLKMRAIGWRFPGPCHWRRGYLCDPDIEPDKNSEVYETSDLRHRDQPLEVR